MKLRKMILRENHEVMKDKEMKLILGGDYMPSKGTNNENVLSSYYRGRSH